MENVRLGGSENIKYLAFAYKGNIGKPSIKIFVPVEDMTGAERLLFEGKWKEISHEKCPDINRASASQLICGKVDGNHLNLAYMVAVYKPLVKIFVPDGQGAKTITFEGLWNEHQAINQSLP